jgi:hypothetical protein
MKKLACIYRACGSELDKIKDIRPSYFNKLKCWKSFYDSFGGNDEVDIYVLYDGGEVEDKFNAYIKQFKDINYSGLYCKSNKGSLIKSYESFEAIKDHYQNVFFCEDDWMFLPSASRVMLETLQHFPEHFVIPYDCPHRYFTHYGDITYGNDYIFANSYGWNRTSESAMCSISMSAELFNKVKDRLYYYCYFSDNDSPIDRELYREMYKERNIRVITSIPTQCTHMVNSDLSFHVDWQKVNDSIIL